MAERYFGFDSSGTAPGDRAYLAADYMRWMSINTNGQSGVVPSWTNALLPFSSVTYQVTVSTGAAVMNGYSYENYTSSQTNTHANCTSGYYRYDRGVIRFDPSSTRTAFFYIIKGDESASSASVPDLGTYDVPIYTIYFNNSSGTVSQTLTDARTFIPVSLNGVHGMVKITSGSGTWTVPLTVNAITVTLIGGGGGGGGAGTLNSLGAGGGGGGGVSKDFISVTPGSSIAYSVGAGGAISTSGPNTGNDGSSTTFTGITTATGGYGGSATGGSSSSYNCGGAGGSGSSGSLGSGSTGYTAGGAGGGPGANYNASGSGSTGVGPGGGGSGAKGDSSSSYSGGAGHAGLIIIEY